MIRWLDFNDTWLAAEWGHPSDNLGGILAVADWLSRNGKPLAHARRADRDDQGPRDPGRDRAREFLQQGRPRSCDPGEGRLHGRGLAAAGPAARAHRQRAVAGLRRRPGAAHLSPRAEHRLAQELGRGRCDEPRGAPGAHQRNRRDGLSLGAHRAELGLLRRAVQGQAVPLPARLRLLCDGERAVQDFLSGRVPRPDRGRSGDDAASTSSKAWGAASTISRKSSSARTKPASASSTRRDRSQIRPTAITACSTWSPCR